MTIDYWLNPGITVIASHLISNTISGNTVESVVDRAEIIHTVQAPVIKNSVRRVVSTITRPTITSVIYDS